jgi:hypothetical protein
MTPDLRMLDPTPTEEEIQAANKRSYAVLGGGYENRKDLIALLSMESADNRVATYRRAMEDAAKMVCVDCDNGFPYLHEGPDDHNNGTEGFGCPAAEIWHALAAFDQSLREKKQEVE